MSWVAAARRLAVERRLTRYWCQKCTIRLARMHQRFCCEAAPRSLPWKNLSPGLQTLEKPTPPQAGETARRHQRPKKSLRPRLWKMKTSERSPSESGVAGAKANTGELEYLDPAGADLAIAIDRIQNATGRRQCVPLFSVCSALEFYLWCSSWQRQPPIHCHRMQHTGRCRRSLLRQSEKSWPNASASLQAPVARQ
jgi:hypothetical protein